MIFNRRIRYMVYSEWTKWLKAVIPCGLQSQALGKWCLNEASQEFLGVFCTCPMLYESVLVWCKSKSENRTVTMTVICHQHVELPGELDNPGVLEMGDTQKTQPVGTKSYITLQNLLFSPKCVKIWAKNLSSYCSTLKRSWHDRWPSSADSDILAETIETHVFDFERLELNFNRWWALLVDQHCEDCKTVSSVVLSPCPLSKG